MCHPIRLHTTKAKMLKSRTNKKRYRKLVRSSLGWVVSSER